MFAWPWLEVEGHGFISCATWIKAPYKFLEQFICEFSPHVLWILKVLKIVRSSMWKKQFLGHFHVLIGKCCTYLPSYYSNTQNPYCYCNSTDKGFDAFPSLTTEWPDVGLGGGGYCACRCGGKPLSSYQHTAIVPPFTLLTSPSVSRSLAQSLLACPAPFDKLCHNCLFSYCIGQKTVLFKKNNYALTICVRQLPPSLLGARQKLVLWNILCTDKKIKTLEVCAKKEFVGFHVRWTVGCSTKIVPRSCLYMTT
jgi:hypothetical protein